MTKTKYANSGIHAITGFELQKNIALFLILENFNKWEKKNYFLYFEHYEDFLFCFINDKQIIESIEMHQSKKSNSDWKLSEIDPIIKKILENLILINTDPHPKITNFQKVAHFTSNKTINLKHNNIINSIKPDNELMQFSELKTEIQTYIKSKLTQPNELMETNNLAFRFIDLNQTTEKQKNTLAGMLNKIVGNKIDSNAAIETLLSLFRNIETNFNQNNTIDLSNKTKRIEKQKINDIMGIITSKKKAFNLWRSKTSEVVKAMKILPIERDEFTNYFNTSFDFFKDLNQVEHIKIYKFVEEQIPKLHCFDDYDCLQIILENFIDSENTILTSIQLKATVFAAYVELVIKD